MLQVVLCGGERAPPPTVLVYLFVASMVITCGPHGVLYHVVASASIDENALLTWRWQSC